MSEQNIYYDLRTISSKLRSLGYLFEELNPVDSGGALDMDNVYIGIGTILNDLSKDIHKIAIHIEENEIKSVKSKKAIS